MQDVGDHLANFAKKQKNRDIQDHFGRSAFNRYYYASFLEARALLSTIDGSIKSASHKAIPEIILGKNVIRRAQREINRQKNNNLINASEASRLKTILNNATGEIAALLNSAYRVRCIADYEPEVRITKIGSNLRLGDHTLNSAKNWSTRIMRSSGAILQVWNDIGL